MLVTINTDASYHTKLRFAGGAFWIVSNKFKVKKAFSMKDKCISSDEAEIKTIINALKVCL